MIRTTVVVRAASLMVEGVDPEVEVDVAMVEVVGHRGVGLRPVTRCHRIESFRHVRQLITLHRIQGQEETHLCQNNYVCTGSVLHNH
jgi:hypothetical protein